MKKVLFIFFYTLSENGFSQYNLVPNHSFEDTISCPSNGNQLNLVPPWYNPNTSSPDYFNQCFLWGSPVFLQIPRSGIGNVGGVLYEKTSPNLRDYFASPLINSLAANKKYCVEFYVLAWNHSLYGISNIGMYLSADSVYSNNQINLPYQPQIVNPAGNILEDTVNWVLISGDYIASGGEKYIVIGNFNNDLNTIKDTITQQDTIAYYAYYLIDDVSVTFCDTCTKPVAKFNYTKNDLTATFNNLTNDTATNWYWDFGDGKADTAQNPVHTYDSMGTYTVTFVACNFICCDTMVGQVSVSVGVDEIRNIDYRLRVYPNPADEEVTITAKGGEKIIITDLTGRKIKEYKISLYQLKINTDEFDNGIYFLCLYSDGRIAATEKLVIVK